jgi:prolyl-tRNA synthetase
MAKEITPRQTDYSAWYQDVVLRAALADYAPVKGCMVIRPRGYAIWEKMQRTLDGMFKATGHVNAYFPMLIPESFLRKEAEHVKGFSPELAVVTHAGGEDLEEPLVLRPTSETVIWSMYKNWIQSYRDLPLLINQWANVIRWEKRTRLFLRTTEFLWQEGHTAHATAAEAHEEALKILGIYRTFAEEYMAIPVFSGQKTETEKFAGAVRTYAIESMTQDRKALQAGTSHDLGQNFAKAFDVTYQTKDRTTEYVWATSWGVSTRLVGALIMAHSDDRGLVLPPKLAPTEVAIVPIFKSQNRAEVLRFAEGLLAEIRTRHTVELNADESSSPGWKFAELEVQGVPIRVEVGPRDMAENKVVLVRRDTGEKKPVPRDGALAEIGALLDDMQSSLYRRALEFRDANTLDVEDYAEFARLLDEPGGFIRSPWCGSAACEAKVKEQTKATIRVLPLERESPRGKRCIACGGEAAEIATFARAY